MTKSKKKICLTGGPSAGKTTIAQAIERCYFDRVAKIPEAASILFGGGFRRTNYPFGISHQQRAIYRVQVEHEIIFENEFPERTIICDRGTLDGWAYWPKSEGDFFEENHTNLQEELDRYGLVIHLDTANGHNYDFTNQLRTESPKEAEQVNNLIKEVWKDHPNRIIIPADKSFSVKVAQVLDIVGRNL